MNIHGKTIGVTGAGQGLGRSISFAFAERGAQLALIDLNEKTLNETARLCREAGANVRCYTADVSDENAIETLFNQVVHDLGGIDGLINNAGITADGLLVKQSSGHIEKMSLEDFNKVVTVNLTGVFLCGREAAVQMVKAGGGGVIINISSISQNGNYGQTNYSAAKAGVSSMTVTWAKELAQYGIRVAGIAPGFSATPMVENLKQGLQENFKKRIPLQRFGKPEEIAHSAVYIMENDYFHGRILEVDGGLRL